MARRKTKTFTEVELEFMQILWAAGTAKPDDISKALIKKEHPLVSGSIRNILAIMLEKGYVTRRKKGNTFLYRAKIPEGQANEHMILDLLNRAFCGSVPNMVAALLGSKALKKNNIKAIKRIIEESDKSEKEN